MSEPSTTKVCPACGRTRPPKSYGARGGRNNRLCNSCYQYRSEESSWPKFFERRVRRLQHHEVSISGEYLMEVFLAQEGICALSGVAMTRKMRETSRASVDRIDCSKAYEPGNVRIVAWTANRMRGNLDDKELLEWCRAMVDHLERQ